MINNDHEVMIIYQDQYSLCKVSYKQIMKTLKNPKKRIEYVKNLDGTFYLRSSKDRELDHQLEPYATEFCKGLKQHKNEKKLFILP